MDEFKIFIAKRFEGGAPRQSVEEARERFLSDELADANCIYSRGGKCCYGVKDMSEAVDFCVQGPCSKQKHPRDYIDELKTQLILAKHSDKINMCTLRGLLQAERTRMTAAITRAIFERLGKGGRKLNIDYANILIILRDAEEGRL